MSTSNTISYIIGFFLFVVIIPFIIGVFAAVIFDQLSTALLFDSIVYSIYSYMVYKLVPDSINPYMR